MGCFTLDVSVFSPPEENTICPTKDKAAPLFGGDPAIISRHVKNIYAECEFK